MSLKKCAACMQVKYCSAACQKAHRSQHKKECRKRAAELHDEALFKQPPQKEDCPICFLRMPSFVSGRNYNSCCGKIICSGCIHAGAVVGDDKLCPFCRTPAPTSYEDATERIKKRMDVDDAVAIHKLGCYYDEGMYGFSQDMDKALELWHRAGELGHSESFYNIGNAYFYGRAVERNEKKAIHYWELAAMGGDAKGRHNLGCDDSNAGNMNRALKHYMIALGCGSNESLKTIQRMYKNGHATKDDYAKALKAYQAYISEIKSDQRDAAAACRDECKYY